MKIIGRTHHMLVSALGQLWREAYLSFSTVYFDDSGSDPGQKVANASALVVPSSRIIAMEKEWSRLKEKEGFTCFHMAEFSAYNPKSEFGSWDKAKHDRVLRRVLEISKKYGVRATTFAVNKKDYDTIVPVDLREFTGKFHYSWAVRCLLDMLGQWRVEVGIPNPLEYVFDWMGEKKKNNLRRRELEEVMQQAAEIAEIKNMAREFDNWTIRHREDHPGLQCVDMIAWCIYQYGLKVFENRPMRPDAQTAIDFLAKYPEWGLNITIEPHNLKQWIDAEIADGKSIKKFREWKEKNRSKYEQRKAKSGVR